MKAKMKKIFKKKLVCQESDKTQMNMFSISIVLREMIMKTILKK